MNTVGRMLSDEPDPPPPTISSVFSKSAGVRTLAVCHAAHTRPGSAVPPSQLYWRGSTLRLAWPISAWLGMLRENEPNTVPSRGA